MKKIVFALLMLVCLIPLRTDADILANSDFANGNGNWQGDAKDIDTGELGASDSGQAGVVINLKKDKWTRIFQLFTIRDTKLYYTVTLQLSKDFKLTSQSRNDYANADLGDIPGMMFQQQLPENCISLLIQGGDNYNQIILGANLGKRGQPQTITGHLNMFHTDIESCFLLAFPPGEGSVTLTTASLSNVDPNAQP